MSFIFTEPDEFTTNEDDGVISYVTVDGKPSMEKAIFSLKSLTTLYFTSNDFDSPLNISI